MQPKLQEFKSGVDSLVKYWEAKQYQPSVRTTSWVIRGQKTPVTNKQAVQGKFLREPPVKPSKHFNNLPFREGELNRVCPTLLHSLLRYPIAWHCRRWCQNIMRNEIYSNKRREMVNSRCRASFNVTFMSRYAFLHGHMQSRLKKHYLVLNPVYRSIEWNINMCWRAIACGGANRCAVY